MAQKKTLAFEVRNALGMNSTEFARVLKVTPGAITKWENGDAKPSANQEAILKNLKILLNTPRISKEKVKELIVSPLGVLPKEEMSKGLMTTTPLLGATAGLLIGGLLGPLGAMLLGGSGIVAKILQNLSADETEGEDQ